MPDPTQIQIPPGHICVTTYGMLTHQTTSCLLEARSFSERNGLNNVKWYTLPGTLVEKARNEAVRGMLREGAGWLLFAASEDEEAERQCGFWARTPRRASATTPDARILFVLTHGRLTYAKRGVLIGLNRSTCANMSALIRAGIQFNE